MINDPAWFYSSLAQTTAAIVGLIGAVLGSRIIEHIGFIRNERKAVDGEIGRTFQHTTAIFRDLQSLPGWIAQQIALDKEALAKGDTTRVVHEDRCCFGGGWSGSGQVCNVQEHKNLLENRLQLVQQLTPIYQPLEGPVAEAAIEGYAQRLVEPRIALDLGPEGENVARLLQASADMLLQLLNKIADLKRKLLPASFRFIFLVLIWLTATGVVWPLAVLPGLPGADHKVLMVGALVVGLLGLIGFFGYQFVELWRLGRFHWHP